MSFVRMPSRPRVTSSKMAPGMKPSTKKKKQRKLPEWDDTVNDLSVYKASPDEIIRRREAVASKNMDVVQAEKLRKQIAKANRSAKSPGSAKKKRHNAFLREVLQNQSQITEALAKSDKVMAVVKDIFGDDPMKFRGLPNVTAAPGSQSDYERLPDGTKIEGPSKLDILSDSVMDQSALNELGEEYDSCSDGECGTEAITYKSKMDLGRFERLLQHAEKEEEGRRGQSRSLLTHSMAERALQKTLDSITRKEDDNDWLTKDGHHIPDSPQPNTQTGGAMNDTEKVQKTKSRTSQNRTPPPAPPVGKPSTTNTQDLNKVLVDLEECIADYEQQTGRVPSSSTSNHTQNTFSNYTTSLVTAVTKLTNYFKEGDQRLRAEMTLREHLNQDVTHLKTLVDALTTDIISTQEEMARLQSEFHRHKRESDLQIHTLRQTLAATGIQIPASVQLPSAAVGAVPAEGVHPHVKQNRTAHPPTQPPLGVPSSVYHNGPQHVFVTQQQARLPMPSQASGPQPTLGMVQGVHTSQSLPQAYPVTGQTSQPVPAPQVAESLPHPQPLPQQNYHPGLPRPNLAGGSDTARGNLHTAMMLSPPRQTDSPRPQGRSTALTSGVKVADQAPPEQNGQSQNGIPNSTHAPDPNHFPGEDLNIRNAILQDRALLQNTMQQIIKGQQRLNSLQEKEVNVPTSQAPQPQLPKPTASAAPQSADVASERSLSEEDIQMSLMQKQLAELNRQHAEAQSKLQLILKQQAQEPLQEQPIRDLDPAPSKNPAQVRKRTSVSPSISPIPVESEQSLPDGYAGKQNTLPSRVITVSMPRVDNTADVGSSPQGAPADNRFGAEPWTVAPSASRKTSGALPKAKHNGGWFSLTSHITAS